MRAAKKVTPVVFSQDNATCKTMGLTGTTLGISSAGKQ